MIAIVGGFICLLHGAGYDRATKENLYEGCPAYASVVSPSFFQNELWLFHEVFVNPFRLSARCIALICVSFVSSVSAIGQSGLVISQLYGGGGNSAATFNADFIELYNPTSVGIATSGLSVQYASATGNFTQSLPLSAATIPPGHYFLVQTITAGTVGASLPTPDTIGSAPNLSATAGKVALVNGTTALSGDTSCALILADTKILDFVGYGATASCFAGSSYAPGPVGNATSIVRTNPATNTHSNSADFSLLSPPKPRNSSYSATTSSLSATGSANPAMVIAGQTTALTVTVTPGTGPASTGIAVVGDLRQIGGVQAQTFTSNGDGTYTFTAAVTTSASGAITLPVTVTDAQMRSAATSIALTVSQPVATTPIHTIQGQKSTTGLRLSPYAGQKVSTTGVVTTVLSNAFFIQARDADADNDPTTPEGIEIFTSTKPTVALGNYVQVTGTVQTYPAVTASHTPATEITSPAIAVLSTGNALPTPVTLTAAMLTPSDGLYQLTPYEGMRVTIASVTASSGTNGSITSANEATETATSTGYFYAVITGTPRPFREPGIDIRDAVVPGEPSGVAKFDDNPERILIDSTIAGGTSIEISTGAVLANVTGVLDFTFSADTYYDPSRLILDANYNRANVTAGMTVQPVALPGAGEFTVASYNIERFYNTNSADDLYYVPAGVLGYNGNSGSGMVSTGQTFTSAATDVTAAAYQRRLQKLSLAVRTVLNLPDVVTLEEVENQSVATDIANRISTDAGVPGLYTAFGTDNSSFYTQDGTGISVGFLVKNTVDALGVSQFGANETFTPASNLLTLNDRPWLVLNAGIKRVGATDYPVTVIANHMKALSGVNSTTSVSTRLKKELQAEDIAKYIQTLQASGKHVISGGDFNAFEFSDGYTDTLATYTNTNVLPATQVVQPGVAGLVTPPLVDMPLLLPANQRWSYQEDGSAQILDHIVVTPELIAAGAHFAFSHLNADFPLTAYNDATTAARTSDHDVAVGYFKLPAPVLSASLSGTATDFGSVLNGATSNGQSFVLTNTGEGALTFTIAASANFAQSNTCGVSPLPLQGTCIINVVFSPMDVGPLVGTLTVATNGTIDGTGTTATQKLMGTGTVTVLVPLLPRRGPTKR